MFIFSKGKAVTFNPIRDRKDTSSYLGVYGKNSFRKKNGEMVTGRDRKPYSSVGKRHNVWRCKTAGQENPCKASNHPAKFGLGLARDHIYSWSNMGDLVYDPMMGSGTTAKACIELNRNFIGSEISRQYTEDANAEIIPLLIASQQQTNLFSSDYAIAAARLGGYRMIYAVNIAWLGITYGIILLWPQLATFTVFIALASITGRIEEIGDHEGRGNMTWLLSGFM